MRTVWDAIEFTKTRGWEPRDRTDDELDSYEGLVAWCARRRLISQGTARRLENVARSKPARARQVCKHARALRAFIYRVLRQVGTGKDPNAADLRNATQWIRKYANARRLVRSPSGITWAWQFDDDQLDQLLGPIAWSLAELLAAPELGRVRLCDGDDCGWLFIDASKSHSRRWCDMGDCGNRAKVARFRARHRRTRA